MNEKQWEDQVKRFLHRTGEEIKRASEEIKAEAERLVEEVRDPEKHRKVKDGLKELKVWAKQTAEELGELVDRGVKRAEGAFGKSGGKPAAAPRAQAPADDAPVPRSPPRSESKAPRKPASAKGSSGARPKKPLGKPRR